MEPKAILENIYQGRMLVFGHRGSKAYAPMNTLPAFELSAEQGAHGIELDAQRSKDGYPVIVHDFTVDGTTDGSGIVTEMTLAELKALDAGSWFGDQFRGAKIPTLDEVFESLGQRLIVNVEIKSKSIETDGVEQVVADCIIHHTMQQRVIVSSFNPLALRRFRKLAPDIPIGFLYMNDPADGIKFPGDIVPEACHPHHELIDQAYMEWARREAYFVNTWTVNDPIRATQLRDLGVNCIISDAPDVVLKALNS